MLVAAIAAYVAVQLGVGAWFARRTKTEIDYFAAGRRLRLFAVSMSLFATWFGAETVMGASSAIAGGGLAEARAEPLGYFLALVLMGFFVAGKLRSGGYLTLGDFFRARFGPQSETWCVIANVIASLTWAAAQMAGLSAIVSALTDLPSDVTLAGAALVVVVYTAVGGLAADVATDVLQGIVLLAGLLMLLGYVIVRAGGFGEALALIPAEKLTLVSPGESWLSRIDSWAVPVLGSLVAVEAIGRFLGAKSTTVARNGAFVAAGVYLFAGSIPLLIGLIGPGLGLATEPGDRYLPSLARGLLPSWAVIVLTGALLSAILSTVDSNMLSVSSLLTRNGVDRLLPEASDRTRVWIARGVTAGAGLTAFLIARSGEGIYQLIEWTSAFGTSGVLVAFLIGAWSTLGSGKAAVAAVLAGFASNAATILIPAATGRDELDGAFLLSIAVSLAAYVAVAFPERRVSRPARV